MNYFQYIKDYIKSLDFNVLLKNTKNNLRENKGIYIYNIILWGIILFNLDNMIATINNSPVLSKFVNVFGIILTFILSTIGSIIGKNILKSISKRK